MTPKQIPESRIAINPVIINDSKRGGNVGRESHHFLCMNGDCLSEVTLALTKEAYKRRFYFSNKMSCPVCSRDMYEVKG